MKRETRGFVVEAILIGLVVAGVGAIVASFWLQKKNAENKYHEEVAAHEKTKSAHNEAVTFAAEETLRAERAERQKEEDGKAWAKELDEKINERDALYDLVVIEHRDGRNQLLNHIRRLTNHAVASEARAKSGAACGDLQERLSAVGLFFERVEGIASGCATTYGEIRNNFDTCVSYAQKVRPQ